MPYTDEPSRCVLGGSMEGSFSYRSQPRRYGKPLVRLNVTEDYGWSARRDHIYPSSAHLREKNFSKGSIRSPDQCASTSVGQSVSDAAGMDLRVILRACRSASSGQHLDSCEWARWFALTPGATAGHAAGKSFLLHTGTTP